MGKIYYAVIIRDTLLLMSQDPSKQLLKSNLTRSQAEKGIGQFFLSIIHLYPIQGQKHQHGMGADTLIAIHKRVIFYETIPQPRRFLLEGGIGSMTFKTLKRRGKSGIQKPLIPNTGGTACFSNQLLM